VSLRRLPTVVLRENFYVSVSGNYHTPSLVGVLTEMGPDRVMFAADHPFEDIADGADWFDALELDPDVRSKIAHGNAQRLLGLAEEASVLPSAE
jgi:predicted TIM-barrel fold metal-dependent hydrolase